MIATVLHDNFIYLLQIYNDVIMDDKKSTAITRLDSHKMLIPKKQIVAVL